MLCKPMTHAMQNLHAKNILLTRASEQNKKTATLLKNYGANPVLFPCLDIEYLNGDIQTGITKLKQSHAGTTDVIFSSSNGVFAVAAAVANFTQIFSAFRIVAIGAKTAEALKTIGCPAHVIPNEASQMGLIESYKQLVLPKQVFFFRAEEGSDALTNYLTAKNVAWSLVPAYRTHCNTSPAPEILQQLKNGDIDAVLLGSAKTALFYIQKTQSLNLANKPVIVAMSPHVAQAADKLGLAVQVIAQRPSFKAMLDGLNQYFTSP